MTHTIYICLGTNLGDRVENFRRARAALAPFVRISACSPVYETPPWGVVDQPAYLNQVLRGETGLEPQALLKTLKSLEAQLGRVPGDRYGPRLIDLDLLFYDDLVLESDRLVIPHPRLRGRAFVLVPLNDLAPDLVHPVFHKSVGDLLAECDPAGIRPLPAAETCP